MGLCLLAVLFAVEAKLAWYGPVRGPGSAISSAKAYPTDTPELVDRGTSSLDVTHPVLAVALLVTLASASAIQMNNSLVRICARKPHPARLTAFFTTNRFFRPPPVL